MGRDKSALVIAGETVLARLCRAGRACGLRVLVIGREARDQPDADEGRADATWLVDLVPGQGPLGGLATALQAAESVLMIGCDMPALGERELGWLRDRAAEHADRDALLCETRGGIEPLFSWYHRRLSPAIVQRLRDGKRALHDLAEEAGVARLAVPDWLAPSLVNVNTPAEWTAFLARPRG